MVQDIALRWTAHAESEGLRGQLDSTMQGRYILQSSFPRNLPPQSSNVEIWNMFCPPIYLNLLFQSICTSAAARKISRTQASGQI